MYIAPFGYHLMHVDKTVSKPHFQLIKCNKMDRLKYVNKVLIDESVDLEFSIKDKIVIGKPLEDDLETEGIGKLLLKNLNDFPDYIGQINAQTGEKTTFAEFKDRSIRCALWLKKLGIGKGDVVCTSIPLQDDDYVPVLAALFVGAITNPWSHHITPPAAEYFFTLVQPKVMFAWDERIEVLVKAAKDAKVNCKFVVVGKHPEYPSLRDIMAEQIQAEVDQFQHVEPENPKNQVGALIFTSGTTSKPKAVMLSYDSLVKNRFYHFIRAKTNLLTYSHLTWAVGIHFLTRCIRHLLTRILHSKFDAEETGAVIEKFKVRLAFLVPNQLTQLYKSGAFKKYDFSSLETLMISGSKPNISTLEASRKALPNTHISNSTGMTESSCGLTLQTQMCKTTNSIGRVVGGVQLKIINPDSGQILGDNQEGELCFKSDSFMIGYLKNPEETAKVIDDEGWLHSGDLGYYDENGEVWITDRLKQIILYQDELLSPAKIEEILLQHPAVADVAVMPVPHEIDNERPFAFVVKKPDAEVTLEELKELPSKYDGMMRLTGGVVFVNEIPYNSNGKKSIDDLKKCYKLT